MANARMPEEFFDTVAHHLPPEPPVDDSVSLDDPSADADAGGADVLTRLLGAQVIEDRRTDG